MAIEDHFPGGVWFVDFEFKADPGENPVPSCMVARELSSGRLCRVWEDELRGMDSPPFGTGPDTLFVAYYASAEIGCFLSLGWPVPARVIDLFCEFRCLTNDKPRKSAFNGLVQALQHYGLPAIAVEEKASMRELAMRGGPWTDDERVALTDYCQSDVDALWRLWPRIAPDIRNRHQALFRGRYMTAVAKMEHHGVPIDVPTLQRLRDKWSAIKLDLVTAVDSDFGVYDGESFRTHRFEEYLIRNDIPWRRLLTGELDLQSKTFSDMARHYPQLMPLKELRASLAGMRLNDLAVGSDGRNRCLLSPFRAKTGRNQPSNSKFIFGPASWYRSLIKPGPGKSVAYVDWSQQEVGIAAALSGDEKLMGAYASGDPYLAFAKDAGAVPRDATKQSHKDVRNKYKACVLAIQYGMGHHSLAERIGCDPGYARKLLQDHKDAYPTFWTWSDAVVNHAMLYGEIQTELGWTQHTHGDSNPRALSNFPMQGNGSEILRLACIYIVDDGIRLLAPVHDAVLIEGDTVSMAETIERTRQHMARASRDVLRGFSLETDVDSVDYPNRYFDERGVDMWHTVMGLLDRAESETAGA